MTKTFAVTGANGLVGSACCEFFIRQGYEVVRLVRQPHRERDKYFELGMDFESGIWDRVDGLVHCAYDFQARTWEEIIERNVKGSERLFHGADKAGVTKIIFISTVSAFEGCKSLYGRSKLATEEIARSVGATIVRPGLVFGDLNRGMFGALNRLVRIPGLPLLPVFSGGRQPMVLIHRDDLAEVIVAVAESEKNTNPIIAAHSESVTFRDILSVIGSSYGKKPRFLSIPGGATLLALQLVESIGLNLPFKSDNLIGLLNPDPQIGSYTDPNLGVSLKKFSEHYLTEKKTIN